MGDKNPNYEAMALKIVPPGGHVPISKLRASIAATLEREVTNALIKQREEAFPDLLTARSALLEERAKLDMDGETQRRYYKNQEEGMKRKHKEKEKELEEREKEINKREAWIKETAQRLQKLLDAFDAYLAWIDGVGEVDENSKRFAALCEAYVAYTGKKPKGK